MEHCSCIRTIPKAASEKDYLLKEVPQPICLQDTTCSSDAFQRGPGQKIVAFSFFFPKDPGKEKTRGYFKGIQDNLSLMHRYYPGWTMRLYFDIDQNDFFMMKLCQVACGDNTLDLCNVKHLPGTPVVDARHIHATTWRFFPTLDPQVCQCSKRWHTHHLLLIFGTGSCVCQPRPWFSLLWSWSCCCGWVAGKWWTNSCHERPSRWTSTNVR